jgi:hypothetical protein
MGLRILGIGRDTPLREGNGTIDMQTKFRVNLRRGFREIDTRP